MSFRGFDSFIKFLFSYHFVKSNLFSFYLNNYYNKLLTKKCKLSICILYPKVTRRSTILRIVSNQMLIEGFIKSLVFDIFIISFLWQIKGYICKYRVLEIYFMKIIRIKMYVQLMMIK